MASSHPSDRVRRAEDKLRAALAELPLEVRKAIAEMATKRLKELDDPDSELNKQIRADVDFIFDVIERLKALPDNATRARVLARVARARKAT